MNIKDEFQTHAVFLIISLLWMLLYSGILYGLGVAYSILIILNSITCGSVILYLLVRGWRKRCRCREIEAVARTLDQKYLLQEVLGNSGIAEEKFYAYLLRLGNKSMLEQVSRVRRERIEYQEFIEQWVHEIKTPIAAMKLQCENLQDKRRREMQKQLERIEHYVEQALFYGRSENVEKDFRIQRTNLYDCCSEALLQCKYLCTSAPLTIHLHRMDSYVYTDEKWLIFILHQLIDNAVKYRSERACLYLYTTCADHTITLHVQDNGRGIPAHDLARIFEKGFTGENGRRLNQHATGIGLYLVKQLCESLKITMKVRSQAEIFTDIQLIFHE